MILSCCHSSNNTPSVSLAGSEEPSRLPASPRGKPREIVRIRPGFYKTVSTYRKTPLRLAKSRLTAVARLHGACGRTSQALWACQLSFALSSCTPIDEWLHLLNLSGALFSLPPLGEVPHSGKGGVVGIFELLPFNEPHPLSQAVRPASSPIGEPRIVRIRPGFHKDMGAYCKTPQSGPLGLPAQLCMKQLYAIL